MLDAPSACQLTAAVRVGTSVSVKTEHMVVAFPLTGSKVTMVADDKAKQTGTRVPRTRASRNPEHGPLLSGTGAATASVSIWMLTMTAAAPAPRPPPPLGTSAHSVRDAASSARASTDDVYVGGKPAAVHTNGADGADAGMEQKLNVVPKRAYAVQSESVCASYTRPNGGCVLNGNGNVPAICCSVLASKTKTLSKVVAINSRPLVTSNAPNKVLAKYE